MYGYVGGKGQSILWLNPNMLPILGNVCYNILGEYLSVVTTVFSQQDGIYGFKFFKRFLEIFSRDLTLFLFSLFSQL
jgi:hypothetical protein